MCMLYAHCTSRIAFCFLKKKSIESFTSASPLSTNNSCLLRNESFLLPVADWTILTSFSLLSVKKFSPCSIGTWFISERSFVSSTWNEFQGLRFITISSEKHKVNRIMYLPVHREKQQLNSDKPGPQVRNIVNYVDEAAVVSFAFHSGMW